MDEREIMPGERIGERNKSEEQGEYAERWDGAMDDAPDFNGEWGYGEYADRPMNETAENVSARDDFASGAEFGRAPELENGVELGGASKLTSYGFDTASRIYGLGTVLKAIEDTDETGLDVENPLGAVYQRIAPDLDERVYLFREIQKDIVSDNQHNQDTELYEGSRLGLDREGNFYDRMAVQEDMAAESTQAISAMKRLLEILETDERFAELREKAKAEHKTIIEYLVSDRTNPTLSYLFNRTGDALSGDDAEEIANEIAEEIAEEAREENMEEDAGKAGEEIMKEGVEKAGEEIAGETEQEMTVEAEEDADPSEMSRDDSRN